jgi:hypothetical protein
MDKFGNVSKKGINLSWDNDYLSWFKEIIVKIYSLQIKASIAVIKELFSFY